MEPAVAYSPMPRSPLEEEPRAALGLQAGVAGHAVARPLAGPLDAMLPFFHLRDLSAPSELPRDCCPSLDPRRVLFVSLQVDRLAICPLPGCRSSALVQRRQSGRLVGGQAWEVLLAFPVAACPSGLEVLRQGPKDLAHIQADRLENQADPVENHAPGSRAVDPFEGSLGAWVHEDSQAVAFLEVLDSRQQSCLGALLVLVQVLRLQVEAYLVFAAQHHVPVDLVLDTDIEAAHQEHQDSSGSSDNWLGQEQRPVHQLPVLAPLQLLSAMLSLTRGGDACADACGGVHVMHWHCAHERHWLCAHERHSPSLPGGVSDHLPSHGASVFYHETAFSSCPSKDSSTPRPCLTYWLSWPCYLCSPCWPYSRCWPCCSQTTSLLGQKRSTLRDLHCQSGLGKPRPPMPSRRLPHRWPPAVEQVLLAARQPRGQAPMDKQLGLRVPQS